MQCSPRSKEQIANRSNGIGLLKLIEDIAFNFASQKYLPHANHEAKRRFFLQLQGRQFTVKDYMEQFTNHINVLDHMGQTWWMTSVFLIRLPRGL